MFELFDDEFVERFVVIQRGDHVIAVTPGVEIRQVLVEAVGIGIAGNVQPVAPPALAIVRRCQQTINEPFICCYRLVPEKSGDFFRCRGQAWPN